MNLPTSVAEVMSVVRENVVTLKKTFGDEGVDLYMSAMGNIQQNISRHELHAETGEATFQTSQVVVFNDDNSNDELVYAIAVNTARKRITVVFRGSVTVKDFTTDVKALQTEIANPVLDWDTRQHATMGVHHGFWGKCNPFPLP